MKKLAVFIGLTATAGLASLMSSTKAPAPTTVEHLVDRKIIQVDGTNIIEYPSVQDAAIISNIPEEVIIQSIITEQAVDGYVFRHQ